MPFVNSFENTGDLPARPFWEHLKTLAAFDSGQENVDPEPALEYFGYRFVTDGVEHGPYETEYVRGHFQIDERGMGAHPEWVLVDHATVGHRIVEVAAALRDVIQLIRADNAQGPDAIMQDLERKAADRHVGECTERVDRCGLHQQECATVHCRLDGKVGGEGRRKISQFCFGRSAQFRGPQTTRVTRVLTRRRGGVKLPW
jgi:hypothetical protein